MEPMSKEVTIWVVIGVYALFMLGVGVWYSRKGTDMAGFTVGGRSAGAWISALSYGTAYLSAVMFIGYSGGSGWSYGLWSVLVGVGNAVFGTLLAWLVLANRTRDITRRHDIKSMPQLFEKRFQSRGMRLFACVVIFVFLIPYSASVYKGLTSVCSVILGIDETVCMLIIAIASAVVLVLGGYMATLKADFVQGFIMMVGVAALIVLVVQSPQVGGLSQGLSNMVDYMESTIQRFYMYNVTSMHPRAVEFARLLLKSCQALKAAMCDFRDFKKSKKLSVDTLPARITFKLENGKPVADFSKFDKEAEYYLNELKLPYLYLPFS